MKYKIPSNCQVKFLEPLYNDLFGDRETGFFVDVGAFDGVCWSNTSALANEGWHGLMFEPNPGIFSKLARNYENHTDVKLINVAIGAYNGSTELYLGHSLTTTSKSMAEIYSRKKWAAQYFSGTILRGPMFTLDFMLQCHAPRMPMDVLSIDTEGTEIDVLRGFSIEDWLPRVVVMEINEKNADDELRRDCDEILRVMEAHDYDKVHADTINSVFVHGVAR